MSEDKISEQESHVDFGKGEVQHNENITYCHISGNLDDFNNTLTESKTDNYAEEEACSAPVEILSEFLSTFMSHDYKSALYYCKLILQYEPDNEIVQDFYPLILEKIALDNRESDEFADNEASSYSNKSETSTEYFSSASGGTENISLCSSFSSDEEVSVESSQ